MLRDGARRAKTPSTPAPPRRREAGRPRGGASAAPKRPPALALLLAAPCLFGGLGCATVDPGDNFVPPEVRLDEDAFFCKVQPHVISELRCASGGPDDPGGGCHASMSALRLDPSAEVATVDCEDGTAVGAIPEPYESNLEAVRTVVQSDALSSPLYRRPTGLDSHPRQIFEPGSEPADCIADWINRGAM